MKKNTLLVCSLMLFGLTSFGQYFFVLDSIRHPNCQSSNGNAYFTLNFQPGTTGILVKWGLMPGSEYFNDFTVLANVVDIGANGTEQYVYNGPEGNMRLYFVYPDMLQKDSIDIHFNSHLINFVGGFSGLPSCDSISNSSVGFSGGTPPYKLYETTDNWQTSTLIGNYPSSDPNIQINVPLLLPIGHYQYKLQDKYCDVFSPFAPSIWSIGHPISSTWMTVCPEIIGDTLSLSGAMIYSKQLTVISGPLSTRWTDTLSVSVNFGDASPDVVYTNRVENWQDLFNISHTYTSAGIFKVQYNVKNKRLSADSWYNANVFEYVTAGIVSVPDILRSVNTITIYPNPVESNLNITIQSDRSCSGLIQILNITGQLMYENKVTLQGGSNSHCLDVKFLTRGFYSIRIKTENEIYNQTFIK